MSIPPQYSQRGEAVEDCRDYLRTGRCKYGSSCKYNHPPNVQSGGGMKVPIDPSEPMFPIRPTEPVCQYYMKHGTCKFGQACKFHHPPQTPLQAIVNSSGTVMMNVGDVAHQLVLNPLGTDPTGSSMMVQFLPQRPDEPDCIYFLKNGRCKYGATCRYHHPVSYHKRRIEESRRRSVNAQDPYRVQKVQYIAQSIPSFTHTQSVHSDVPVSFLNLDGATVTPSYQTVPIITSSDGTTTYGLPITPTEPASSASSLASSYDTAGSSLELHGDSNVALWNRARRNGSGGSLNAYTDSNRLQQPPRVALHSSASDGSIASRRARTASHGSASDSVYYDAHSSGLPRNPSVGSWRTDRSASSVEHSRIRHAAQYAARPQEAYASSRAATEYTMNGTRSPQVRGRVPQGTGGTRGSPRRGHRQNEEGITRMTSALLNMLDTPEEIGASFEEDDPRIGRAPCHMADPNELDPSLFDRLSLHQSHAEVVAMHPSHTEAVAMHPAHSEAVAMHHAHAEAVAMHHARQGGIGRSPVMESLDEAQWSPSMRCHVVAQCPPDVTHHLQQHHRQMQPPTMPPMPSSNSSTGSDVGLYLP